MKWHKEVTIPANIETIWNLFQLENMPRIMPNVVRTRVIDQKEGVVGSTYEQEYKEGKRTMKYIVTDLKHEGTPERKLNRSGFQLAKMFNIEVEYELIKVSENETRFIYSGQNEGTNFFSKMMLKFSGTKGNDKVVDNFVETVQREAVKDQNKGVSSNESR